MAGQHYAAELESLGLSPAEAAVYEALIRTGPTGAQTIADHSGVTRSTAYASLRRLSELGLVEAGSGYGSRFRAADPEQALSSLLDRQRVEFTETLAERELVAKELAKALVDSAPVRVASGFEVVEIMRNERAVGERYDRLQMEAQREVAVFVKPPFATAGVNTAQQDAMRRGVRYRALYERSLVDHEEIAPFLEEWIAEGEEARIYRGELPFKLALFDSQIALMPLETPDSRHAITSVLLRHDALGTGLGMLFDCLWESSIDVENL